MNGVRVTLSRALVVAAAVGLALTTGSCSAHTPDAHQGRVTLTPGAPEEGACAPERLVRCVPRLGDFAAPIFDYVDVDVSKPLFASLPAAYTTPEAGYCKELPRPGAVTDSELDVTYLPADAVRKDQVQHLFYKQEEGGDEVNVRLLAAGAAVDMPAGMADWQRQCPTWGIARTSDDRGTQSWLVAQSNDVLRRYQAGDVAGQWRNVVQLAAATLPNGVIVQTWYRTDDPSIASRNHVLSMIVDAVGRPRQRSALPPSLSDWNNAEVSELLPPLAPHVFVRAKAGESGTFASLCQSGGGDPVPPYRLTADWQDSDTAKWSKLNQQAPEVSINQAQPGVDYLAQLRREITACAPHVTEFPTQCGYMPNRQFLQSDSVVAEGEDTLRITHRWIRVENVQAYDRCVERIEALRVTQLRGLLVISRAVEGGPKQRLGDTPLLSLSSLDEAQASTVRRIKAA